jgi:DNA-binding NarL/FixJ family response regulator
MKILVADDHALFRQGLLMIIEEIFPTCSPYQCNSWEEIPQGFSFDLIVVDIFMPRQRSWFNNIPIPPFVSLELQRL